MSQNRGQNKDWEPVINITNINIIELPQPNVNGICTIWPLFYGQFSPIVLKAHLMPPLHYVLKVLIKSPSSTKQNQTELIQHFFFFFFYIQSQCSQIKDNMNI